jgi:hypothetical protein
MPWLDINEYDHSDKCSICLEKYGTIQAIYQTDCKHNFHNKCLHLYCESAGGEIVCPLCKSEIPFACLDVDAFEKHNLGNSTGRPLFNGNTHILEIYNRNHNVKGGRRGKKGKKSIRKTNKRKTNKRKTNKRKTNKRKNR